MMMVPLMRGERELKRHEKNNNGQSESGGLSQCKFHFALPLSRVAALAPVASGFLGNDVIDVREYQVELYRREIVRRGFEK